MAMTTTHWGRTLALAGALAALGGCVTEEIRPVVQVQAVQAKAEVPVDQLLDVGVRLFDPGVSKEIEETPELGYKDRIYPEIRKAEARVMPGELRETLEGTGLWGAVRVIPATVEVMDVMVAGRIVESTGAKLELAVKVTDATGREWLERNYSGPADTRAYKDGAGRARDPFQNVYAGIANDMQAVRQTLTPEQLKDIRRVAELRFAQDFAPAAMEGYLRVDKRSGRYAVARLPAEGDPVIERIERIRERDANLVDTVSDSYGAFSERAAEPYLNWRRYTYDEIVAEEKLKAQARNRMLLGAAAVLGGVLASNPCSARDETCNRAVDYGRYGAVAGGVAAIVSGVQKREEAKIHTDALKEISGSFETEAAPLNVEVEGRTLQLTGTAEAQYAEWRKLLEELYKEETGGVATATPAAPTAPPPGGG